MELALTRTMPASSDMNGEIFFWLAKINTPFFARAPLSQWSILSAGLWGQALHLTGQVFKR